MLHSEVKRIRDKLKKTQLAFAEALGVKQPYIAQIESGKYHTISFEFAAKICKLASLPLDHFAPYLAPGVAVPPPPLSPVDLRQTVALAGSVSAGGGIDDPAEPGQTVTLRDCLPGADVAFKVSGVSMVSSGIHDGDFIGVARNPAPDEGSVIVARVDDQYLVKVLRKRNNRVMLAPMDADDKGVSYMLRDTDEIIGVVTSRAGRLVLGVTPTRAPKKKKK